jgi:hypothetical protein
MSILPRFRDRSIIRRRRSMLPAMGTESFAAALAKNSIDIAAEVPPSSSTLWSFDSTVRSYDHVRDVEVAGSNLVAPIDIS